MKKITLILLSCLLVHLGSGFALDATGSFKYGFHLSQMRSNHAADPAERKGLFIGMCNNYVLGHNLWFQPELLYVQNGVKDLLIDYIEIPFLIKTRMYFLNVIAGPSIAFNISSEQYKHIDRTEKRIDTYQAKLADLDFNFKVGVSRDFIMFSRKHELEIRYSRGLTNISTYEKEKLFNQSFSIILNTSLNAAKKITDVDRGSLDYMKENIITKYKYLMTKSETEKIVNMNSREELHDFMNTFWRAKDPTPGTEKNEFQEECEKRISILDSLAIECDSDRGRVFLLYGPPDDIVRDFYTQIAITPFDAMKAIEVWLYDMPAGTNRTPKVFENLYPGQMKFIFADMEGLGIYTQIFSTEKGEVVDSRLY